MTPEDKIVMYLGVTSAFILFILCLLHHLNII
jgi:hypothetical protein